MNAPLIGITLSHFRNKYGLLMQGVTQAYLQAVQNAGGIPVLLPLTLPVDDLRPLLEHLQGVIFTGGGDIEAHRYGLEHDAYVAQTDAARDQMELDLFEAVIAQQKPFLGICRGIQLVNVALGGSLYTDIQAQVPGAHKHDFYPLWPRPYLAHTVTVAHDTRLADIIGGGQVWVNSLHHQAIRTVGQGLQVSARSPEGLVEAVELSEYPFGLAVQWHPEWLQTHEPMRALFRAFIAAASTYGQTAKDASSHSVSRVPHRLSSTYVGD